MNEPASTPLAAPKRQLTLFDSTCIIVGIIIGAGIYRSSPDIAGFLPGTLWMLAFWLGGGLFAFIGSLCYAELAIAFPRSGGAYVFLTRAYGRWVGFLFAWCELWVVRPGSIGAMAFVFAEYAQRLLPIPADRVRWTGIHPGAAAELMYAAGAIVVLTAINIVGVQAGKWTQNLLTVVKVCGLILIVVVGFGWGEPQRIVASSGPASPWADASPFLALVFILFAYGGWDEMGYVGAEVRDPQRNILRALLLGAVAVTVIYLLVNMAFVSALGYDDFRFKKAVASVVLEKAMGSTADRLMSALICLSALGAVNGQIFTGARIYYAMGTDHRLFAPLGRWNARLGTPLVSLVVQAAVTLALVVGFGRTANSELHSAGAFEKLVVFTTPVFWLFLLMVALSVIVLRRREPDVPRPFRTPGYPVTPLLFYLACAFMLYKALDWAYQNTSPAAFWSIGLLAAGVVVSLIPQRRRSGDAA